MTVSAMSAAEPRRLPLALAILRISLGGFLLLWGIEKLVRPQVTVAIWEHFYFTAIGAWLPYVIGVAEILFAAVFLVGWRRRLIYGAGMVLHGISVLASWKQLLDPWGLIWGRNNHLFLAGVPVLAGFIALYLLRDLDRWTVDGRRESAARAA